MRVGDLQRIAAEIGRRRVVVLSDRYPPDSGGGAELSLHLLMREPALRDQSLVVTFDKSLPGPRRREIDGVDVLALPMNAAWPLHRMSQDQVERLKARRYGLKWPKFLAEAAACALRDPKIHGPALGLRLVGDPPGGVRMAHATVPEGRVQPEIRTVLDAVRPDVVHADNARSIMMAADVLAERAEPLVAFVRDHRFTSLRFDQALGPPDDALTFRERLAARCARAALAYRQACLRRATAVIATSAHLAETLAEIVPAGRLKRLPLEPVELPQHGLGAGGESFSILVVGTLTRNKGQAHLLEAWPEIVARIPNARIDFAGQGEARSEIERVARRLGVTDRVTLHGHVTGETLARLYRDCDVVALPTLWSEPFGRVPLEAGAAGRPVVAYASGGLVENVLDGVTGRLAPSRDVVAFAEALADLAADPQTRRRMGEAGRARVAEAYAPSRLADQLAGVWDEAAGTDAPQRSHA
ncbi:glycosyltransferase family 4 protein [Hansschlegelia zhihuaiae]|uniref:Glycosyltransferase family 1 protein n=1 Tax=Hansschlegelia zhihuaiae TaxID=405005 RepID=A0A4Q0MNM2_9HYPH|nr:glycosyltransferase family 4 protein [Hansschlegelia zhihuaiae]RXF75418.1 glycosyltransferase family 1 protein [Hansschlegelia zhihuaiae]